MEQKIYSVYWRRLTQSNHGILPVMGKTRHDTSFQLGFHLRNRVEDWLVIYLHAHELFTEIYHESIYFM